MIMIMIIINKGPEGRGQGARQGQRVLRVPEAVLPRGSRQSGPIYHFDPVIQQQLITLVVYLTCYRKDTSFTERINITIIKQYYPN